MSNFDGFPIKGSVPRWGSLVEWDSPEKLPFGVARVARNVQYKAESFRTRNGLARAFVNSAKVTGMGLLKYTGSDPADVPAKYPLIYDTDGNLLYESPQGSGTWVPVSSSYLETSLKAQICCAYDNAYIAQSDLIEGQAAPIVFSGKNKDVQRMSELPLGSAWQPNRDYVVGDVASPTSGTPNRIYRCSVPGTSGAVEPTWKDNDSETTADNSVSWIDCTPFMGIVVPTPAMPTVVREAGTGALAAGKDVYVKVMHVNDNGETSLAEQVPGIIVNTVLNDALIVTEPIQPKWNDDLAAPYKITKWRIYTAAVATGAAVPADSTYKLAGEYAVSAGSTQKLTDVGAGAAGVTSNSAYIAPLGNICAGKRWMVTLFENSNGYIDGISDAVPVSTTAAEDGYSLFVGHIPIGRANTRRRICAFTVAGDGKAGRYYYIPADDRLYPGDTESGAAIEVTKTVIEDNVTTSAVFTFLDSYLTDLSTEVTEYFNKQEIPACSHIAFSKNLNRMVLTGVPGYPSGHWVSPEADPETFTLPGCEIEVAENDGDRTVGFCDVGDQSYSLKENSGHKVISGDPMPSKWGVFELWRGSGPCGPLAFDVTSNFLIYMHTTGPYLMANQPPTFLGPELARTWKRINKAAKHTIVTKIDEVNKEVHFLLPLDGATEPNYRVRLMVKEWNELGSEPIVLARTGGFVANTMGRKWSIEPLDCHLVEIMERDLAGVSDSSAHRQVLYARPAGLVSYEKPDYYSDENAAGEAVAIDCRYDSCPVENPKGVVLGLGGVTVSALGSGNLVIKALGRDKTVDLTTERRICTLNPDTETYFDAMVHGAYSERWSFSFQSDGQPGTWFELREATLHLRAAWATRKA